jgi:hypothetical protein
MTWQPLPDPTPVPPASGLEKAAEPTDPYVATAVALDTPGHDGAAAMTRTFIEEFARLGWSRQRIQRMFRIPRYVAANAVYRARGPEFVAAMIEDVLGPVPAEDEEA